jgi:hypothetical protein
VTLDQLAEIVKRVKDAKFSGTASAAYGFGVMNLAITASDPPADFYTGTASDVIIHRSYADQQDPPVNLTNERKIRTESPKNRRQKKSWQSG